MTLTELNELEEEACRKALFSCCGSTSWVRKMLEYLPYTNNLELEEIAAEVFRSCSEEDWLEAFSHHAKLGKRKSTGESEKKELSKWEKQEQKGTAEASNTVLSELEKANETYENKFGFIYLLCATGKTADFMLDNLSERLSNDRNKEMQIAMEEQNKITKLRLQKLLL